MNIEAFFYPNPVPINYMWTFQPWIDGRTADTTDYIIKDRPLGSLNYYYNVPWYARRNWGSDYFFCLPVNTYSSEFVDELIYSTSLEF